MRLNPLYRFASYMTFSKRTISESFYSNSWKRLRKNVPAMVSLITLCLLSIGAIVIPMVSTKTYFETFLTLKNSPPSMEHWFGTDELGRDIFIRIWWGARISLFIGIAAAILDVLIGIIYGATAGYCGGKTDELMMRITDIFHSIPSLLIIILLMVVLGSGISTIILALALTGWINMARLTRGQILKIRELDYVIASKMCGASPLWIIWKHCLPNIMGTVITTLTLTIPLAIFTETFLSFLGLGVQAPIASWGTMAQDGLYATNYYPWRLLFPASFICVTMLSFNTLGDGLRDAFDVRRIR